MKFDSGQAQALSNALYSESGDEMAPSMVLTHWAALAGLDAIPTYTSMTQDDGRTTWMVVGIRDSELLVLRGTSEGPTWTYDLERRLSLSGDVESWIVPVSESRLRLVDVADRSRDDIHYDLRSRWEVTIPGLAQSVRVPAMEHRRPELSDQVDAFIESYRNQWRRSVS
jgi:hypothetical protein